MAGAQKTSQNPPMPYLMAEGATASCMAACFSNPFEVVKIRLQLQGELQKRGEYTVAYRGTLNGMGQIAKNEGVAALQKGLVASFGHQIILNGLRLGLYGPVGGACQSITGGPGYTTNFMAGFICGGIGAACSSPIFLAKTRLQSQSCAIAVGTQHQYKGLSDALVAIFRVGGVRGLWHGVGNAVARTSCGSAVQLSTYDESKRIIQNAFGLEASDMRLHLAAAICGGAVVAVTMNPFDVVMTRTYNDPNHQYKGNVVGSLAKVVRVEGLSGLYKGSFALWTRIGPHTLFTFMFLEQIKQLRPQFEDSVESIVD